MSIINIDESKCGGCNSCVRVCPSEAANTAKLDENGHAIITINDSMCIKCGACIKACTHGARYYIDDTDEFMEDVAAGRETALIVAPAIKIAFIDDWADVMTYFRNKGVKFIYDVSFGADICTWVHVRYMQSHPTAKIISQPCAAIVNYTLKHNHDLIPFLSPGQSPMMCTAIYMRKYDGFRGKIAAISPCIAKRDEFKQNNFVINYNVTLERLKAYLDSHGINYRGLSRNNGFEFDGPRGYVGAYYSQPGGLKTNLRIHAPKLAVINSEGTERIYKELDKYITTKNEYRPPVFDVLNCQFGCNGGPALGVEYEPFKVASDSYDCKVSNNNDRAKNVDAKGNDKQFLEFDQKLKIDDFLRSYTAENTGYSRPTDAEISEGLKSLHKYTPTECHFDCHACGYKSCRDMAGAVARGLNVPENCRQYILSVMASERENLQKVNLRVKSIAGEIASIVENLADSIDQVEKQAVEIKSSGSDSTGQMDVVVEYMGELNSLTGNILTRMKSIDGDIESYSEMTKSVKAIAGKINLLSLNASIESARAGEAGRAFAVVAQNIRELSESSKKSVERAQDSEDSIRSSVDSVNQTVDEFTKQVSGLTERLSDARAKAEAVSAGSNAITEAMNTVGEIAQRLEKIVQEAEDIFN